MSCFVNCILPHQRVPPHLRDNALAACLKFALFRSGQVDSAAILDAVLPQYPLQADTFEARESHNLLINEFEASNPILLGDSMSNAPQLIRIFFSLLGASRCRNVACPVRLNLTRVFLGLWRDCCLQAKRSQSPTTVPKFGTSRSFPSKIVPAPLKT